jgi:hypothetical protein
MDEHCCNHGYHQGSTPIDPEGFEQCDQHDETGAEKSQGVCKRNVENHAA